MKGARSKAIVTPILILLAVLYLFPFLFLLLNSFKPFGEILTSFLQLPKHPTLKNYVQAWSIMEYPNVFKNTFFLSVLTAALSVLVTAMAGYALQRRGTRFSRAIYLYFLFGLTLPFHVIMVSLLQLMKDLHLTNSLVALALLYVAFYSSFGAFVYYGFTKSLPREIEEAAIIDGCNPWQLFLRVVFPLLQPATITLVVLFVLWTWNDFLAAYLMLDRRELRTITLNQYVFVGDHKIEWDLFIASLILSILPIVIFYAATQKYLVKGLTVGAVKG